MRRLAIVTALAGTLMTACGGGLSDQDRTDFLAGCESGGSTGAQCQCMLEYFEENGVESATDITAELTIEAATSCAGQGG